MPEFGVVFQLKEVSEGEYRVIRPSHQESGPIQHIPTVIWTWFTLELMALGLCFCSGLTGSSAVSNMKGEAEEGRQSTFIAHTMCQAHQDRELCPFYG